MEVVIIGAGEVGTSIADNLAASHEVTVVDIDEHRAEQLQYELDVLTMVGDGTVIETLERTGVADADMFLACTSDDRGNLVACGTAKTLGDPFTIARTKQVDYLRTWERDQQAFGVDFMVCSDLLAAESIVRLIGLPGMLDLTPFAGGLVHVAELELSADTPVTGDTVAAADRFESLTFAGLFRDGELVLPTGDTVLEGGDRAVVIGSPESVRAFAFDGASEATRESADDIVIAGGSEIGYQTARLLEERKSNATLVEPDTERARELAELLPETRVMEHDPTDTDFLEREHIDETDTLVTAFSSDEQNLLVAVLVKRLGVEKVIAIVENPEYVTLFEEIGIDVAVNPRKETAEEIIRFSFESAAENLSMFEGGRAEVLEFELDADSTLVGRSLRGLDADTPGEFVVGAITRDRSLLVPRGDTELRAGDHVIVFAEPSTAAEIASMA